MFPIATTLGNTYVLKPSERVPLTTNFLAKLLNEINFPAGVFNVLNGGFETVKHICQNPKIRAISFVGGNDAGKYIYSEGAKNGKRIQSNMAAKNHAVIMPDCDAEDAMNNIVGATFGASGQRLF